MPPVTCLTRFIDYTEVTSVEQTRETSYQLQRLLDISSYLSREEKQVTRRAQIVVLSSQPLPKVFKFHSKYIHIPQC